MTALDSLTLQLAYSDEMNRQLLTTAGTLDDAKLDQAFDMGLGTLRKTLAHIYVGEMVWLERWKGHRDTPWPPYETTQAPAELLASCEVTWKDRSAFFASLKDASLETSQVYRDSKGSLFRATLHEMILQGVTHSTHHRAQAVNMIRRLGGPIVDVDFMYWRRQPA